MRIENTTPIITSATEVVKNEDVQKLSTITLILSGKLSLKKGGKMLDAKAFDGCSGLQEIELPQSGPSINPQALTPKHLAIII
ncbi:hypothetical protein [Candidatus Synchoanobacter obligatus]|uniref:Leucine-rich repeat domain-containing protein n=1 Tax=Candidatus Synchoanobacter obligatus TaxID=2919597 RepID=A0ABT1L584_9GAMM|nr:hypothetical protein [Candidatus Synchoanobacter obligatus]MCP8352340.1 hypothetical protein [Candidatus Synchoanobacter obligatus]